MYITMCGFYYSSFVVLCLWDLYPKIIASGRLVQLLAQPSGFCSALHLIVILGQFSNVPPPILLTVQVLPRIFKESLEKILLFTPLINKYRLVQKLRSSACLCQYLQPSIYRCGQWRRQRRPLDPRLRKQA